MKFKNIFLGLTALFIYTNSLGQTMEAKMSFEKEKYNFGNIKEDAGKVSHKFVFTNLGAEPIVITNVNSSCGCTTPSWSREPVPPGGKGFINAVFDPSGRKGKFHKTITIRYNESTNPKILHIVGNILTKEDLYGEYKYLMGPIRMNKRNIHFSQMYNDEKKTQTIKIMNVSEENIKIGFQENRNMPGHLNITCEPTTLKPKEKAVITINYNAKMKNDWGYVYDRIFMNFNGKSDFNHRINISTTIKERFSQEVLDNPPIFSSVNGITYDFGTIKEGEKIEHEFKFKNTGKHDLIIRKTKASCGCTAIAPKDKIIKPGQVSSIKTIFNSTHKTGKQLKTVRITTNIPDNKNTGAKSEITLSIKGNVESPKTDNMK